MLLHQVRAAAFKGEPVGKRSRDSEMTGTLFFLTVISLRDKWNHMLAAGGGRKMEQEEEEGWGGGGERGKLSHDARDGEEEEEQARVALMMSSFFFSSARRNFNLWSFHLGFVVPLRALFKDWTRRMFAQQFAAIIEPRGVCSVPTHATAPRRKFTHCVFDK